jgi:hypothetical protein
MHSFALGLHYPTMKSLLDKAILIDEIANFEYNFTFLYQILDCVPFLSFHQYMHARRLTQSYALKRIHFKLHGRRKPKNTVSVG